jgi:hypothetical protein
MLAYGHGEHSIEAGAAAQIHDGLTWPPQPRGISLVKTYQDAAYVNNQREIAMHARIDVLEKIAKSEPGFSRALGNKYKRISIIDNDDRSTVESTTKLVYFSRDMNSTIEVDFDSKKKVRKVLSLPAWQYQPEIVDAETLEASDLARKYFLEKGYANIAGLTPFGILAYKPEGNGFFETRVIYISFHKDNDAPPEFAAWVDLSNLQVIKARVE